MTEIKDKNGLTLDQFLASYNADKYPKPSVTADICVFARDGDGLLLLLIKRGGHPFLGSWALPGGFANKNEPLEQTAARELAEETGIEGLPLALTGVYSKPGRDPRGWTISAAYTALVEKDKLTVHAGDDADCAAWFSVVEDLSGTRLVRGSEVLCVRPAAAGLAFDHDDIIADALAYVKGR